MTQAAIESVSPSFIVANVSQTISFYQGKLGFEVMYQQPDTDPFFAIVQRGGVMIFLKDSSAGAPPLPNSSRDPSVKWDSYFYVPDPKALAEEFAANSLTFRKPLGVTSENLLGFEVADPNGYVLFFGRPN
jgi:catechol 2,3-dioxygenase-like lactoylglutathione lyase family enzyme